MRPKAQAASGAAGGDGAAGWNEARLGTHGFKRKPSYTQNFCLHK